MILLANINCFMLAVKALVPHCAHDGWFAFIPPGGSVASPRWDTVRVLFSFILYTRLTSTLVPFPLLKLALPWYGRIPGRPAAAQPVVRHRPCYPSAPCQPHPARLTLFLGQGQGQQFEGH
jgi:hypothetical protein